MSSNTVIAEMLERSLAKHLRNVFVDCTGVWIATKNFEHNKKTPPYIFIKRENNNFIPYQINNIKTEFIGNYFIISVSLDWKDMVNRPVAIQQEIISCKSDNGIDGTMNLWDFGVNPETLEGSFEIELNGVSVPFIDFDIDMRKKEMWKNIEFSQIIPVTVKAVKDKSTRLL